MCILKHIKNGLPAKFNKSNFELVGRKYFNCLIAVQNFKKFEFETFKTWYDLSFACKAYLTYHKRHVQSPGYESFKPFILDY